MKSKLNYSRQVSKHQSSLILNKHSTFSSINPFIDPFSSSTQATHTKKQHCGAKKKIAPFSISNDDDDDDVKGERNPNWSIPVTATAPPFRNGLRILSFVPCQSPEHVWPWPEPVNENNFFQIFINTCPTVGCVVPCGGTRVCLVGMFVFAC